jgi:hypothetical protein
MPPEYSVKQWILLYYEENSSASGKEDKFWTALGRQLYKEYSSRVKVNDEVRGIASQEVEGAKSDQEKVARLVEYCRKNLKDVHGDQITTQQREQHKENWSTIDILREQSGTEADIRLAFVALATAAGFDARLARMCRRDWFFFNPQITSPYFLDSPATAVKVDGKWKFYDVMNHAVAPGQLPWQLQDVSALVTDPKDPEFVTTPLLTPKETMIQRGGAFTLSADGTLEGVAHEIFWGNEASRWREEFGLKNDAERESEIREELKRRFADFDLSDVRFGISPDASKPAGVSYHIVVSSMNFWARMRSGPS